MKIPLRIDRDIDVNEFISIVQGKPSKKFQKASGVCLDTRVLKSGDIFFAIQSVRDGHEFIGQAVAQGASACVVNRDMGIDRQIIVPDTLKSLWTYATHVRSNWGKKIVAISGSNGKTSTKEITGTLLGEKALRTPGTWNNDLGVPLALLLLQKNHDFAVLEMGINHYGELRNLCLFTQPNVALLTNIGPAHLEGFKNLEGVARAKSEIFETLQSKDTAVLNMDDPYIKKMQSNIKVKIVTVSQREPATISLRSKKKKETGYNLSIQYGSDIIEIFLELLGEHNISNYLCALGTAHALGIEPDQIIQRTKLIQPVNMRMETMRLKDRTLINDCYNANLGSFQAALQTVSESKPKRFLVLMGDILEMGSQARQIHRDLGKMMAQHHVDHLFITGEYADEVTMGAVDEGLSKTKITIIEKKPDAVEKILPYFLPGDILLVKGSRGMKLEEIIDEIRNRLKVA